jgi:acyl dehydratase
MDIPGDVHPGRTMSQRIERTLTLTAELLRAYSRRGNFHSEPAEADRLGLPGLVAQGMQVAAPAYGALLERWGDDLLERGVLELKFLAMVVEDDVVIATVEIDEHAATFEVARGAEDTPAVMGSAMLRGTINPAAQRGAHP